MSPKTKKLSIKKYKGAGVLLYQNIWHQPKQTKKLNQWSKFKKKMQFTELRKIKPMPKYAVYKTLNSSIFEQNKYKFQTGFSFRQNIQQKQTNARMNDFIGLKKVYNLLSKPYWFFNTAAPIPGVASLKKRKALYQIKQNGYKILKAWLSILNKKQIKNLFFTRTTPSMSTSWTAILQMESMYQSFVRKNSFALNAQQGRDLLFSKQILINNSPVKKARFVQNMSDMLSADQNFPHKFNKLQSFYATKKPVYFTFQKLIFYSIFYKQKLFQIPKKILLGINKETARQQPDVYILLRSSN